MSKFTLSLSLLFYSLSAYSIHIHVPFVPKIIQGANVPFQVVGIWFADPENETDEEFDSEEINDNHEPTLEEEIQRLKDENARLREELLSDPEDKIVSPRLKREYKRTKNTGAYLKRKIQAREFNKEAQGFFDYDHPLRGAVLIYVGSQYQNKDRKNEAGGMIGGKFYLLPFDNTISVLDLDLDLKISFGNHTTDKKVPMALDFKGRVAAHFGGATSDIQNGGGARNAGFLELGGTVVASVNSYDEIWTRKKGQTSMKFGIRPEITFGYSAISKDGKTSMHLGPELRSFIGPYHLSGGAGFKMKLRHKKAYLKLGAQYQFNQSGESVWVGDRAFKGLWALGNGSNYIESDQYKNLIYYGPFKMQTLEVDGSLYYRPHRFFWLGLDGSLKRVIKKKLNFLNEERWNAPKQNLMLLFKAGVPF
ncbi:MAG: hypothetical protein CL678_12990 [Bdellovibrionaceae bacterium]|nr:hypothetical protein [Pseudobdellovibrionaceae bacterium]|tara:strand:+ start:4323 stop:5585 length:1263 start_codon:yes stop_codon:yes gene_type:complete